MIKALRHISHQPFIAATGLAALVHSTWSLAVLFSGEPPVWEPTSLVSWAKWAYWLIPALLIAFALDIGQIATSSEIRSGQRTVSKYTTFQVFAFATYYLQWLYIAHHMPSLELGAGVYSDGLAGRIVLITRNAAIWFIPALLPLSTTMYTLSGHGEQKPRKPTPVTITPVAAPQDTPPLTDVLPEDDPVADDIDDHTATCEACGWAKTYTSSANAKRGLATHQAKHCTATHLAEPINHYQNGLRGT